MVLPSGRADLIKFIDQRVDLDLVNDLVNYPHRMICVDHFIQRRSKKEINYPSPHKQPWAGPRLSGIYLGIRSPRTQLRCGDEACPA
jgi:hypothetical protein